MLLDQMKYLRLFLGLTECFVALGAIPAGLSMIFTPDGSGVGMSTALLTGSPFPDFFIPGIFLLVVNGLFQVAGAIFSFGKNRFAGIIGLALGIILLLWIVVQIYFIGLTHFLQVLFLLVAIVEIVLGSILINKRPLLHPSSYVPEIPDYWPTREWKTSTPEEQGMDSSKLVEMLKFYQEKHANNEKIAIDSITIIRNAHIVADIYFNPFFPKDTQHIIHSCTKSIVSALVGIAVEKGYIKGVEVPILELLDKKDAAKIDERLKGLTLFDLLTMQTGWHSQDSYLYQWRGLFEMQTTDDWCSHILNLSFEAEPGTRFDYSNMASFLLAAILKKATGQDSIAFAREQLFEPLGIEDFRWEKSPKGIGIGWGRMWLKPLDMAKIGLLYLQKGKWGDQQIIPAQWVKDSTKAHSFPKKYRYVYNEAAKVDYKVSGGLWLFTNLARPFADGYGYQWWLDKSGRYSAVGTGGQFIIVCPKENLVVAFTSKLSGLHSFLPTKLLDKYILPATVSNKPLKPNEIAYQQLTRLSDPPQLFEEPKPIGVLPAIARQLSELSYSLETNPWQNDDLRLIFESGKDYALLSFTTKGTDLVQYEIGLNNIYRISKSNGDTYAARGTWVTATQFVIDYEQVGYSNKGRWTFTFEGNQISVQEEGVTGIYQYKGKKKITEPLST